MSFRRSLFVLAVPERSGAFSRRAPVQMQSGRPSSTIISYFDYLVIEDVDA
jgi:hypothetical protein